MNKDIKINSMTIQEYKDAERAFAEWIHDNLETIHVPTNAQGWLKRAWMKAWSISKNKEKP